MTGRRARRVGRPDDGGFVAPFTAAIAVALIALVGMVMDGGRWIRAQSDVFGVAAAAARAATQQIDQTAALQGELRLDEPAAQQAAYDYLAARDLTGFVRIDDLEVTVTAQGTVDFQLVPVGSVTVEETATARATQERAP